MFLKETFLFALYIYEHEATQKPISENNIGAPSAPQQAFELHTDQAILRTVSGER